MLLDLSFSFSHVRSMPKVNVYHLDGSVVGEEVLDDRIFAVEPRSALVHQAVVAQMANIRVAIAHTKTKGEVRGGGKKPWAQKHTGRARQGSIRSPQWRGGGVVFGPRQTRNYAVRLNKKMKRQALLMTLSDKVASGRFILVDQLDVSGKTKEFARTLNPLWKSVAPETPGRPSALMIMPSVSLSLRRATKNLKGVEAIRCDSLNVLSILKHQYALTTRDGVKALTQQLASHRTEK